MTQRPGPWKLLDLLQEASGFLATRQVDNARLETEWMLAAALDIRRIDLYLQFEKVLSDEQVESFRGLVRQRLSGRPLQYITGEAGFRLLDLTVDERVLVPRPETEILVEEALRAIDGGGPDGSVLDIGCGSGAIAISVAHERPAVRVLATDISSDALAVARGNAERHGVSDRVGFVCGDLLDPIHTDARFDLIVSNPPYIEHADIEALQPEVRDFEPHLALDGGADGLDVIRRLAVASGAHLLPGGRLLVEVGAGQSSTVEQVLREAGFAEASVRTTQDLAGVNRVVTGTTAQ